jgi:membrane-associated phospholipid phosphatase
MTAVAAAPPPRTGALIVRLMLFFVLQGLAFLALWRFFVTTVTGQDLDTIALTGNTTGSSQVDGPVSSVLNAVSVASVLAATAVVGFIALARRRFALGVVATLFIACATGTAQLLKSFILRPDLGVDPDRAVAGNSLPSGHAAVAASVAVALVFVLPPRARGFAAVFGATYVAAVGVATMSAGWHRPSDSVASYLVVGAWAAVAGLALLTTQPAPARGLSSNPNGAAVAFLVIISVVLLVFGGIGLGVTEAVRTIPTDVISQSRLMVAYAGSVAGVAGSAGMMMALILLSVHRVVPPRLHRIVIEPALVAPVGKRTVPALVAPTVAAPTWVVPAPGSGPVTPHR